ncbi:IS3 family transposase [Cupriavidus necator]
MSKARQTYSEEFQAEAVRLVLEQGLTLQSAAQRLGIPKGTLTNWVLKAKAPGAVAAPGGVTVAELAAENARLRKELAEAKLERDIVKKGRGVLRQGIAARYAFVKQWREVYPIKLMCRVLGVSRSGYYDWVSRPQGLTPEQERLRLAIRAAHKRTRQTYGTRRLQRELADDGFVVGRDRLGKLREELGIRCRQKRRFVATTRSAHDLPVAPNLLEQKFEVDRPNAAWVSDISYVATDEGWLYVAGIKDLYTCEIVGYALGPRMTQELVGQALLRAVHRKRPKPGLILHSDRGSQYCAHGYRRLLDQFGMQASMSRKGNCYDNAPMESFWGSLKAELVYHYRYATRTEAMASIREYIEIFYNRQRRHSKLGYRTPGEVAASYIDQPAAA